VAELRLEGVVAGYGRGDVLQGVDLEVPSQGITCVIGPNGAGKSTVLKTISGLLRPREGTIALDGRPIHGLSPKAVLRAGIVQVPQDRSLFPLMTVWENLLMGAYLVTDRAEVARRADAVAADFPILRERASERAGALSGGQQKLVEIARSLMAEPQLVLLDEPSMGLDPRARHQVFEAVGALSAGGRTVVLVEQNARAALEISDRGVVMETGRVALVGPAASLLDDPRVAGLYLGGLPSVSTPKLT
jgi:branched-chain amino acid transport system ATP-binding protein